MRLLFWTAKPGSAFKSLSALIALTVLLGVSATVIYLRRTKLQHSKQQYRQYLVNIEKLTPSKSFKPQNDKIPESDIVMVDVSADGTLQIDPPSSVSHVETSKEQVQPESPEQLAKNVFVDSKEYWRNEYVTFRNAMPNPPKNKNLTGPPPNFDKWSEFAELNQCMRGMKHYVQIFRDFEPFVDDLDGFRIVKEHSVQLASLKKVSAKERQIVDVPVGKFTPTSLTRRMWNALTHERRNNAPNGGTFSHGLHQVLQPIASLMPGAFEYAISTEADEPRMLPAETSREQYVGWEDVFRLSKCAQESFDLPSPANLLVEDTIRDSHGFFLGPDHFLTQNRKIPVISQAKTHCFVDIVMPMRYHLDVVQEGAFVDPHKFEDKKDVLFWRGANSGGRRTRLLEWERRFAQKYPNNVFDAGKAGPPTLKPKSAKDKSLSWLAVDIGFHRYVQTDKNLEKQLGELYPVKSQVSFKQTVQFKYLLVVDGNTWPSRLSRYLQSNSVILLATAFTDWYMWMLEPWVHYIPVRMDLTDLEEKLRWAKDHEKEVKEIVKRAQTFIKGINRIEQMWCYTGLMMLEYSRLYDAA
ncbi:Glycosyltransferase Family 90 domain containing protein [Rhizoclosmatium sp. JEL0117]|nr:Glycosyltransferase Family 90 domain containing protein [Rhizoclosmatium sp. JEL0117]